ncbi:MAG: hypothetical protein DME74_00500 [Verrucomicrobia bacterium]|nr:MAG: hypothetical protein DME74_00500 [Verrucomicrobiota bacterium]
MEVDDIISYHDVVAAAENRERSPRRLGEACPARHAEASESGSRVEGAPRRNDFSPNRGAILHRKPLMMH